MADATPAQIAGAQNLLVIASTWGEGDPPQRAIDFMAALMADDAPRLDGAALRRAGAGRSGLCEVLRDRPAVSTSGCAALGAHAHRAADRMRPGLRDAGRRLDRRHAGALQRRAGEPEPGRGHPCRFRPRPRPRTARCSRTRPFEAEITERDQPQQQPVRHPRPGMWSCRWPVPASTYEPGDSLGFVPRNDPALVEEVLAATGLAGDAALRAALIERFDITTLTRDADWRLRGADRRRGAAPVATIRRAAAFCAIASSSICWRRRRTG